MKTNIRIIALAHHLINNPNGLTIKQLFFFLTTRGIVTKRKLFYKDIATMKSMGLLIRFEGNKIILTNKNLPNFWE
ncbi:hypothetical protein [Flavobacterium aciduliphilum]|uniref:Uncharacterized protein n=1 Tax=Flavobacterium aciduliphilum TaxID=1101402 RepID=A0A328YID9_9FLAO|nr:hypothetical protein [Flavobacterium aciduliphilum]RAR73729.1 hypothetical protein CLV55_10348 [Flavobacterium aciduliphilum]